MRQKCGCGRTFERLHRTTPDGHEYTVTGCPMCLDDWKTAEAFDELVKAAMRMEIESDPEAP